MIPRLTILYTGGDPNFTPCPYSSVFCLKFHDQFLGKGLLYCGPKFEKQREFPVFLTKKTEKSQKISRYGLS